MPTIVLRFYGRFVFAESSSVPGQLKVLAIDPGRVPGIAAERHDLFAIVNSRHVDKNPAGRVPDFSTATQFGQDGNALADEQSFWNLSDVEITIPGGGFRWQQSASTALLADLQTLAKQPSRLSEKSDSITAVINLQTGVGQPTRPREKPADVHFEPLDKSIPTLGVPDVGSRFADSVEVTIDQDAPSFTIATGGRRKIMLWAKYASDTIVVCLSNICSKPSHNGRDPEFAALYEVLEHPPAVGSRLIPSTQVLGSPFGEFPCYAAARLEY